MSISKQIVIMALGNPFRSDDGVGAVVCHLLKKELDECFFIEGQNDSLAIINAWEQATLAILVDAANSEATAGKITRLELKGKPLPHEMASCSSHGLGLAEAIDLARELNKLPQKMIIYAVEAESFEQGETLSPAVKNATNEVVKMIKNDVKKFNY